MEGVAAAEGASARDDDLRAGELGPLAMGDLFQIVPALVEELKK